eukprot:CAMPEP_0181329980 /NCGR_PEP_ID=MMETSP1101-20121128/23629_1 /TAXON_ID=46948 /ORGANISM="Rhodomonas abbreviata, Strain Caron Lab Isolate" /LENGTH=212 /DNA_ID=CAMNT_0023439153 /DNA_START=36 /DNA_END=671 /DNA_ORIENTATION=-
MTHSLVLLPFAAARSLALLCCVLFATVNAQLTLEEMTAQGECSGVMWNATTVEEGHACLGCEWLHVFGGVAHPELMGLYQRQNETANGKFVWRRGFSDSLLVWSGEQWVLAHNSTVYYAAEGDESNPLFINETWSAAVTNTSAPQHNGSGPATYWVGEPALLQECVATAAEFDFDFELRDLWTFGFNFYGELAREEGTLRLDRQAPARVGER